MSLTLGTFFLTIGAQVASAVFNSMRSNRLSKELTIKQHEFEEKSLREGIKNARAEMTELYNLQRQLDAAVQTDRLQLILDNAELNIELIALVAALDRWPLFIAPYVITNGCLCNDGDPTDHFMFPINCILTTSSDREFNHKIFPDLEENVAEFCLKYWNESAEKSIRFYKGAWRNTMEDASSRIEDIQAHLSSVPTMVVSPKVRKEKLFFRFHWWGLSSNPNDVHFNNELDFEISVAYTPKQIQNVISQATAKLSALISYFADLYYWNFYHKSPTLPILIDNKCLILSESNLIDYASAYINAMESTQPLTVESGDFIQYAYAILPLISTDKYQVFSTLLLNKLSNCFGIKSQNVTIFDLIKGTGGYWSLDGRQKKLLKDIILSEKTINSDSENNALTINKKSINMNVTNYVEYKNQLVGFAESVLKIDDLLESDRIEIEKTKNKVETDQFCITLVGEYQGGKSTTFNAICGGRDISPRGNNMKTSACRIRATNIPNNIEEYAVVKWKSDAQLIQTIKDILPYINPEDLGYKLDPKENFSYEKYVQLGNPQHIKLIRDAMRMALNDNPSNSMRDILYIAPFIVEFYSCTINLRDKTNGYTLSEVLPLMVFPKNMKERLAYGDENLSDFTETEALFAFVETIDCYIHSEELRRLGCSVIDCPGMFASDYDTSIAMQTIVDSDAVLYLLSGAKEIGEGDQKALSEIHRIGEFSNPQYDGKNIFFAINQRQSKENTSFLKTDLIEIKNRGFNKTELPLYNALLYYYAKIGFSYIYNKLDEHTKVQFMSSGRHKNKPFKEKWVAEANDILIYLWLDDQYKITDLDQVSCDTLMSISNVHGVLSSIEDYIVRNKAYSILVDNGAKKMSEALLRTEKALLEKQKDLLRTVEEREAAYKAAIQVLETFMLEATDLINKFISDKNVKSYVSDIYVQIFQNTDTVNEIAFEATKDLMLYIKRVGTKWDAIRSKIGTKKSKEESKAELKKNIGKYVKNAFNNKLRPLIELYVTNILKGKDRAFNKIYNDAISKLQKELEKKWAIATAESPLLNSIPSPIVYGDIKTNIQKSFSEGLKVGSDTITDTASGAISQLINDIVDCIVNLVIGVLVGMMYDFLLTGGIGSLFMVIYGTLGTLMAWIVRNGGKTIDSPDDLSKDGKNIYNLIRSNIYDCVNSISIKEKMCFSDNGLITAPYHIIQETKKNCEKQLTPMRKSLEEEIEKRRIEFALAKEILEREAARIKKVREESLMPIISDIRCFVNKVINNVDK